MQHLLQLKYFLAKNKERESITFYARAVGDIEVIKVGTDLIQMSFPNRMPSLVTDIPEALLKGLTIPPQAVYKNNQAFIAVYNDEQEIAQVNAKSHELKRLAPFDVSITAQSSQYDFISRYFWPANGGDEDPVTGSIHAGLVPLWAEKLNKSELDC